MSVFLTPAQQAAVAATGNVVVVAGAGTGKTTTLVQRCLELIRSGVSVENLLLVTFTEAAALEMRTRLRESLARAIETTRDESERAHALRQAALLDTPCIGTLHGFCLRLLREHFHEAGVDPQASVLDESQAVPLRHRACDRVFELAANSATPRREAFKALLRDLGRGSEESIRETVDRVYDYTRSLPDPEAWLARQQSWVENPVADHWVACFVAAAAEWQAQAGIELAGWTEPLGISDLLQIVSRPSKPCTREEGATLLADVIAVFDDASKPEDKTKQKWPRGSGSLRKQIRPLMSRARALLSMGHCPKSPDGLDPIAEDWEITRPHLRLILDLVASLDTVYSRTKAELGLLDFSDLEQRALRLLIARADGAPTAVARSWSRRFEYIFVDEYQDINAAQDAVIRALDCERSVGARFLVGDAKQSIYRFRLARPALFQAYQAEWNGAGTHGTRLSLAENFRSQPALLGVINHFFAFAMPPGNGSGSYEPLIAATAAEPQPDAGAAHASAVPAPCVEWHWISRSKREASTPGDSAPGPRSVGIEPSEPATDSEDSDAADGAGDAALADLEDVEREARALAIRLRGLVNEGFSIRDRAAGGLRPVQWRDITILLRAPKGRVETFAQEFARQAIPLEACRGGFLDRIEIADLLNVLRLLDNPLQDLPLLSVLRSPLAALSIEDLAWIRALHPKVLYWHALRHFAAQPEQSVPGAPLWPDFKRRAAWEKCSRFLGFHACWRRLMRNSALSKCLDRIIEDTRYSAIMARGEQGVQRLANLRKLSAMVRTFDPLRRQGLYRFLQFIAAQEELGIQSPSAPASPRNAVRLMSIHQSKGLEFPVTVVAGLGSRFNESDLNKDLLINEDLGLCPRVIAGGGARRYSSPAHWLARVRERNELEAEELRLLYVAMTRARDKLILSGAGTGQPRADGRPKRGADWIAAWIERSAGQANRREPDISATHALSFSAEVWEENDPRWRRGTPGSPVSWALDSAHPPPAPAPPDPACWLRRLEWVYPHAAAAAQAGKASVSALREQLTASGSLDDEEDSSRWKAAERSRSNAGAQNTAAAIGTACHRFLECMRLDINAANENELRADLERMVAARFLTAEQAPLVEIGSIAKFWNSPRGQEILRAAPVARRELAFTARLAGADFVSSGLSESPAGLRGEFMVLQGVADLLVLLPEELWLLDYKTDKIPQGEAAGHAAKYLPQLKLYSLALSRIYQRPVTRASLYFLRPGAWVDLD